MKTGLSGWRAAHSITFLPAQGSVKAGPRVTILSRNLAAASAFAMRVDVWRARSSNPWWRAWDCQQGPLSISMALRLHLEPDQRVVPHGPDRNLDVYEVLHESGGRERLGSTFGPYQSGAGHGATAVGECRTPA